MMKDNKIKRGDIFIADLNPTIGSEQYGRRPVVVLSNDLGNKYSPTILIAPITTIIKKQKLSSHIFIEKTNFLKSDSMILLEQIRAIDKIRLESYKGSLDNQMMYKIDKALINEFSIDLINYLTYIIGQVDLND